MLGWGLRAKGGEKLPKSESGHILKGSSLNLLSPGHNYGLEIDLDPPLIEALILPFMKLSFMCVLCWNYPMGCRGNDCIVRAFGIMGVYITARTRLPS